MAEETFSIDFLEKVFEITKNADISNLIDQMHKVGAATTNTSEILKKFGENSSNAILEAVKSSESLINGFLKLDKESIKMFDSMSGGIKQYIQNQDLASHGAGVFALEVGLMLEPFAQLIPPAITGMGNLGNAGYEAGSKISTAFKDLAPILPNIIGEYAEAATAAYGLQREIISLSASQGRFKESLNETGNSFDNIEQSYMDMIDMAHKSAQATGQTVSSVMDLAKQIGSIPKSLTENITVGETTMNQLVATSKLATGFMRDQSEVAKLLSDMYSNLGVSGIGAYESLAKVYEKAGDSKLRFEAFTTTVMEVAKGFKMLGDNTNAAANVVSAFDEVFKNSDISPSAMSQVITSVTSGVQTLGLAKEAFISSQTGGPGGMAGAYQMEYALQTGDLDKVLTKTMDAMQQQFGGQVLTLKEAAENPALAGEFYKQVQYLTQVAGVAKDDREAYRILEAMQGGVLETLTGTMGKEGGKKTLEIAVERGNKEQERTNSILMTIHQELEMTKLIQNELVASVGIKEAEKILGAFGIDSTEDRMKEATGRSSRTGILGTEKTEEQQKQSREDIIQDYINGMPEAFKKSISAISESITSKKDPAPMTISGLAKEPVGAEFSKGNTTAGIGQIAGITPRMPEIAGGKDTEDLLRKNSPIQAFADGNFPPMKLDITAEPIEVNVTLKDFDEKIQKTVDLQINKRNRAAIQQAGNGVATP